MRQWLIWAKVIAASCMFAAVSLMSPARAQPVAGTEAGVAIGRGYDLADRIHDFHGKNPPQISREDYCKLFQDAHVQLHELSDLYWRAKSSGQTELADRLGDAGDELDDELDYHEWNFRNPCPPPFIPVVTGFDTNGPVISLYVIKTWGNLTSIERLASTNEITNQFHDWHDPFGAGISVGYMFTPWANNVVVDPFVSFDYLNASVNHTFTGGSFLGTTDNFSATAGVKIGPQLSNGLWLYGIAGVSVLDEKLNINFVPISSSTTVAVPGATVGVGVAFQPSFLQGFGHPVSVFAEYQHTWWEDAHFNTPTASPAFDYTFHRQDDFVKFGFSIALTPPAPAPSYPVKALPPK